ncbi:hypothetical protein Cyrtocomes_00731 [Candidatus Cyrtobacter comes]|uniref:Uncharacterized protein n=1 Tax=Candidatus Cyrtobacter comes TaxID=675776 RepID=A0ABU5L8H1_9RICK|nr:hypothetical protein [Candidatus Cyrtobacter comes]MDZ5762352.1 hypothetical protein [Candidatus Cyrtobacter comes]
MTVLFKESWRALNPQASKQERMMALHEYAKGSNQQYKITHENTQGKMTTTIEDNGFLSKLLGKFRHIHTLDANGTYTHTIYQPNPGIITKILFRVFSSIWDVYGKVKSFFSAGSNSSDNDQATQNKQELKKQNETNKTISKTDKPITKQPALLTEQELKKQDGTKAAVSQTDKPITKQPALLTEQGLNGQDGTRAGISKTDKPISEEPALTTIEELEKIIYSLNNLTSESALISIADIIDAISKNTRIKNRIKTESNFSELYLELQKCFAKDINGKSTINIQKFHKLITEHPELLNDKDIGFHCLSLTLQYCHDSLSQYFACMLALTRLRDAINEPRCQETQDTVISTIFHIKDFQDNARLLFENHIIFEKLKEILSVCTKNADNTTIYDSVLKHLNSATECSAMHVRNMQYFWEHNLWFKTAVRCSWDCFRDIFLTGKSDHANIVHWNTLKDLAKKRIQDMGGDPKALDALDVWENNPPTTELLLDFVNNSLGGGPNQELAIGHKHDQDDALYTNTTKELAIGHKHDQDDGSIH